MLETFAVGVVAVVALGLRQTTNNGFHYSPGVVYAGDGSKCSGHISEHAQPVMEASMLQAVLHAAADGDLASPTDNNPNINAHQIQLVAKIPFLTTEPIKALLRYSGSSGDEEQRQQHKTDDNFPGGEEEFESVKKWFRDYIQIIMDWITSWLKQNPGHSLIIVIGLSGITIIAVPGIVSAPVLWAAGFSPGGVVAGSWAASIHSAIGVVAPGSKFAILQSAGAGGYGAAILNGAIQGFGYTLVGSALMAALLEILTGDNEVDEHTCPADSKCTYWPYDLEECTCPWSPEERRGTWFNWLKDRF